jgi:hypothetical protein
MAITAAVIGAVVSTAGTAVAANQASQKAKGLKVFDPTPAPKLETPKLPQRPVREASFVGRNSTVLTKPGGVKKPEGQGKTLLGY